MALSNVADPVTPAQVIAALANITQADAQAILNAIPVQSRTPGLAVITATTLGQVQAAVGLRRSINPFAY